MKSGKQPSVMSHNFSQVPKAEIQRSSFDRSHGLKTTFNAGDLVPIFVDEALPGDTFNLSMSTFARLATPLHPFMDNMFLDTFFFAVPIRLIWDNWQKFNGEQRDPGDSTDYLVPQIVSPNIGPEPTRGFAEGSIYDHMGVPIRKGNLSISAFWCRAYNLIWNEWFRDQNLQASLEVPRGDGPDDPGAYLIRKRGKRHDYFTSCLPWPQKGPAVPLPLGDTAPVFYSVGDPETRNWTAVQRGTDFPIGTESGIWTSNTGNLFADIPAGDEYISLDPNESLKADLSEATASTINQLRQAFQIQRLYERDARGGTRYTEILKAHFGVTSPDARLQRPEYLGGGSTNLNVNPIAQTSSTDETSPQGNLAAIATASSSGVGFTKSFTEHCVIIGLVSARADLNYQQGLNRMWSRRTRWDFYWPALSHLGEQAVLNKEIFAQGGDGVVDNGVFGYQERYAEYRYKPSVITGAFRSQAEASLDTWHLAQDFESLPTLNYEFIEDNPPVHRVVATPDEPDFLFDSYFRLRCARPMPTYSVPGLIDHF